MYLATTRHGENFQYCIRQSYYDKNTTSYRYRNVFDLGSDPTRYIEQVDDVILLFDEPLEEAVSRFCRTDSTPILEQLLWQFLPVTVRQKLSLFQRRTFGKITPLSDTEKDEINRCVHLFDRRRLYYIRYGAVDQARIYRLNDRLYRPLLYKCRDEIEFYFQEQEKVLRPTEWKTYIYAILNLQQSFDEIFASFMPEALEQKRVEELVVEEVCRLNSDLLFWRDGEKPTTLHYHLQRYIIQFFDNNYENRSFEAEYIRNFRQTHRKFRWPENKTAVTREEASAIFNEKFEVLQKMNKQDLARLFRKKAKELHPDSGGDHDTFIGLLDAYEALKKKIFH